MSEAKRQRTIAEEFADAIHSDLDVQSELGEFMLERIGDALRIAGSGMKRKRVRFRVMERAGLRPETVEILEQLTASLSHIDTMIAELCNPDEDRYETAKLEEIISREIKTIREAIDATR